MTNRLKNYRRIGNWENFFLDSAVYSIAKYIGVTYDNEFTPIAAITGDLFTYMYSDHLPCDSGLTNYVVIPERVVKAYASFGWNCEYLSGKEVNRDIPTAISKIRASVDRGLPVLAWGVSGVPGMRSGEPMGEGALIGGYDDDVLLVHLYCGAERLPAVSYGDRPGVDEDGYTAIPAKEALSGTDGLFILTDKITPTEPDIVYREVIRQIPVWLTLSPTGGRVSDTEQYVFGKAAFTSWASVLLDDTVWQNCDEGTIWNQHCCAFCSLCTSTGSFGGDSRVVDWLNRAQIACSDLPLMDTILPLYRKMSDLWKQIWDYQNGFMPSVENMQNHDYRAYIANTLIKMGNCCDEIYKVSKQRLRLSYAKHS